VTITGTGTEIHDNGGWGITAEGNVVIHEGALMSVNKNGKGGIIAANEVSVPPNFEVADNGGRVLVVSRASPSLVPATRSSTTEVTVSYPMRVM
jgi:hypothetical protein